MHIILLLPFFYRAWLVRAQARNNFTFLSADASRPAALGRLEIC
jgi:hypothetical protein